MSNKKTKAIELPYFRLIEEVIDEYQKYLDKENPITYVIADCSNNEDTYGQSIDIKSQEDFYNSLSNDLKPKKDVELDYKAAKADNLFNDMNEVEKATVFFPGRSILTREGIKKRLILTNHNFFKLYLLNEMIEVFKIFIKEYMIQIQDIVRKFKITSASHLLENIKKENSSLNMIFVNKVSKRIKSTLEYLLDAKLDDVSSIADAGNAGAENLDNENQKELKKSLTTLTNNIQLLFG